MPLALDVRDETLGLADEAGAQLMRVSVPEGAIQRKAADHPAAVPKVDARGRLLLAGTVNSRARREANSQRVGGLSANGSCTSRRGIYAAGHERSSVKGGFPACRQQPRFESLAVTMAANAVSADPQASPNRRLARPSPHWE